MEKFNRYLDRCILDPYATKSLTDGFSMSADDIPEHEMSTLIEKMLESDCGLRDLIHVHIQELIDARLPDYESDNKYYVN